MSSDRPEGCVPVATVLPVLALVVLASASCDSDDGPDPGFSGDAEMHVLFVGNSLTSTNDLPAMVADIAAVAGRSLEYRTVTRPGFSLEEHWHTGTPATITELGPDVVVMQQGPSSVGTNPFHLRSWSEAFAPVIREAGGRPALLMVWPESTRQTAFDAVRSSYAGAAAAVDGLFVPAGQAWLEVWARDPEVTLYGPDGFHPSRTGTFVAALTVFAVLFEADVRGLPPMVVPAGEAELLYEAVHAAVAGTAPAAAIR